MESRKLFAAFFVAFALLTLGGGNTVAAEERKETIESSPASREISLNRKSVSADFRLSLLEPMPLESCIREDLCEIYALPHVVFNSEKYVVSEDFEGKLEKALPSSHINTHFGNGEDKIERDVIWINARTPIECVNDENCAWFAFYRTAFHQNKNKPNQVYLKPHVQGIKWALLGADVPSLREYLLRAFKLVSASYPYKIEESMEGINFIFAVSDDPYAYIMKIGERYFSADLPAFKRFLLPVIMNYKSGQIRNGYVPFPDRGGYKLFLFFFDLGERAQSALPRFLMESLGFRSNLQSFPFSVLNVTTAPDAPSIADLTSLDLFMIRLIHAPEFSGSISKKEARELFKRAYSRLITQFSQK